MTAKTFKTGDIPTAVDFNEFTQNSNAAISGGTIAGVDINAITGHLQNSGNPHGTTKSQVGLSNVDNTSDANKPVSSAQAAAIAAKADALNPSTSGTLTHSGDIILSGTGKRITGDFSNFTLANRVMFQTSTVNGQTSIGVLPNGTSTFANLNLFGGTDTANASIGQLVNTGTEVRLSATFTGTGTILPMTFYTGGAERMRIDTAGNALVNLRTACAFSNGIVTPLLQVGSTGPSAGIGVTRFTSFADAPARLVLARSGSDTLGTDAVVPSNTNIGAVDFQGYDGSAYAVRANIRGQVEGAVSSANIPTAIVLSTGATMLQERLRIDSSGNVLVTNPAGLGYGTGAGGTVTQSTSKFTAVTLNKPTGQITMNNAALAAGTAAVFAVNNSLVSASDTVLLTFSGNWISNYSLRCTVYSGQFYVLLKNESGGSLSESVVINFAIIKGATA